MFTKIEDAEIEKQVSRLVESNAPVEKVDEITYDDFAKVQLKTAEVVFAERVPKSEKLLRLQVKLGAEERQLIAGIAKSYTPEEITGKKILIVANLKPAKIFGFESKGMILAVEDENGKLNVVEFDKALNSGLRAK